MYNTIISTLNEVNEVNEVNKVNEINEVNEVNEVNKVNEVNEVNKVKDSEFDREKKSEKKEEKKLKKKAKKKEEKKAKKKEEKKEKKKEEKKEKKKEENKTISIEEKVKDDTLEFIASEVSISTCTVLSNLNSNLNLGLISRFIPIHDQLSKELDEKKGGIYNLEFYGNCARGETLIDKIKDEFNNQATVKFKYWGFRNVNVKFFANGKLQMTGLKYEDESKEIARLLIDIINDITVSIKTSIESLKTINKTYDFQLVYYKDTKEVFYYRKYYDRFLIPYEFDTDIIYNNSILFNENETKNETENETESEIENEIENEIESEILKENDNYINILNYTSSTIKNLKELEKKHINYNRKNYIKEVQDVYNDTIEENNISFLKDNNWYGDNAIKQIITKIEHLKYYFIFELETALIKSNTLVDIKKNIELLMKKYTNFKFSQLDKILGDINKNLYANNEYTIHNLKNIIFKFNKQYLILLEKTINRLVNIRSLDIQICNYVKHYLMNEKLVNDDNTTTIPLEKLELMNTIITEPHNYKVSGTQTVLINSDLSINHNIDLKRLSKLLKKEGFFNTYEPDDYPGVLTKYYFKSNNTIQGICNCPTHCSTLEKHSICTKITISIFRTGSIIITGARNTVHLMIARDKILDILKTNLKKIKGVENEDDNKQIAILNNAFRKISKKSRLFFIKKEQIEDYDKINKI